MGIKGAAIATDISMLVSSVFVMSHFFDRRSNVRFRRGIYRLRAHVIGKMLYIGAAPSLVNAASCAINVIINISLARYGGNLAIAAAGIFTTYTSLICMTIVGICQGMQPIVGYNFGAGNYHRLRKAFWLTTLVASILTAAGAAGGMLVAEKIARAFTTDSHLIEVTASALPLAMLVFLPVGFQIVSTNFFMAIGSAGKSIFLSLIRQVIFLIPLLLVLPLSLGLKGIWLSFPASDLLATLVTACMILTQLRKYRN